VAACGDVQKFKEAVRRVARQQSNARQRRDHRRNGETVVGIPSAVTVACPAVLVIGFPLEAELIGESLAQIAMTGHAVMPEGVTAHLESGGILWKRRLGEWIVGGCGYGGLRQSGGGISRC
jgi:hypothetical protein